jgi:hypothetical protein
VLSFLYDNAYPSSLSYYHAEVLIQVKLHARFRFAPSSSSPITIQLSKLNAWLIVPFLLCSVLSGPQSFKQSTFLIMAIGCICGGLVVGLVWVAVAAAGAAQVGNLRAGGGGADRAYRGYQHWHQNQTLSVKTLVETPFARAQMHTVKLESGKVRARAAVI